MKEKERLEAQRHRTKDWRLWGPYLSERAWGTVLEETTAPTARPGTILPMPRPGRGASDRPDRPGGKSH